jgi:hypothetical protein
MIPHRLSMVGYFPYEVCVVSLLRFAAPVVTPWVTRKDIYSRAYNPNFVQGETSVGQSSTLTWSIRCFDSSLHYQRIFSKGNKAVHVCNMAALRGTWWLPSSWKKQLKCQSSCSGPGWTLRTFKGKLVCFVESCWERQSMSHWKSENLQQVETITPYAACFIIIDWESGNLQQVETITPYAACFIMIDWESENLQQIETITPYAVCFIMIINIIINTTITWLNY